MTQQNKVCTRHNEGRKDTNKGTSTQSGTSVITSYGGYTYTQTYIIHTYIHTGLSHAVSLKENIHFKCFTLKRRYISMLHVVDHNIF